MSDDQDKFKAYDGPDADGQQGAAIGEAAKYPHMMYDPKTGKEFKAETPADHEKYAKMGYTHDKPEEIDEASKEGTIRIIDLSSAHPDNKMGAKETSGHQVQRMTKGKFVNQGKPYAKKAQAEKERNSGQSSMQFEAKNVTTDDNALVSFYQIHSTSPKPRLAGHMNMQVLGGQHQMSAADIKKISNQAAKAGVGKMVKVDNSMLSKHIADYKNENKPAPPKIAVALSQHHAKSLSESADLQEGAARQAALAKGLMDYCKEIGKDHMDHKDFADHAKHVKAGNWDKARAHADDQDTEVREKIHTLAIDHLGQGAASELYGGDRVSLSKNKGDGKLHASYNESVNVDIDHDHERDPDAKKHNISLKLHGSGPSRGAMASGKKKDLQKYLAIHYGGSEHAKDVHPEVYESVNVDDVLALIDQGYTLDQAEAMVAEASCGTVNASRKVSKAGDNDRNMANDQRSIPAKGADTAPVRPGTKQNQRDFDKAARMAKSKDKVSLKPMPAALTKKMETEELHGNQHKLDHNKDGKIDAGDMKKVRKHGAVQKESVMDRVSNMVEDIRAKNEISELHKKTLGSYAKKAMDDVDTQSRFATEYEKRGMAAKNPGVMDKNFKKANRADDKLRNRKAGIKTAIDKMTKESVQEAAKPTGIHHSTPVTAAQANDEQAAGRWTDKAGRNTMTEKEFVDMHTIHPDVLPEFDGNVAAKQTAEAIKKAPKVSPTPNKNPPAGDKKIVKSTEAPAANAGVVGESYMDKYARYIRGEI